MSSGRLPTDGIVVGGGIIGLASAVRLSEAGFRVTVLEREGVSSGATGASAGMLAPLAEGVEEGFEATLIHAFEALLETIPDLEKSTGIRVGLSPGGLLHVPLTKEDEDNLHALRERYERRQWPVEWLEQEEVARMFPHLRVRGPVLSSLRECHLFPEALTRAYARLATLRGVDIRFEEVVRILPRGNHVEVRTRQNRYETGWVVLAAGAWSARLLPRRLRRWVPVFPVRGQMIAFAGVQVPVIVWTSRGYALPKGTFQYVGATVERVGFRNHTTRHGRRRLVSLARSLFPALRSREPEVHWAGLRPGSADGLPIVGWIPETRILVATGHYRNGILLSELTGRWVRDYLLGSPPPEARSCSPSRFG